MGNLKQERGLSGNEGGLRASKPARLCRAVSCSCNETDQVLQMIDDHSIACALIMLPLPSCPIIEISPSISL